MGKYYQQTVFRTIIGGLFLIFAIAFILIWAIYGKEAAFTGFSCMLSALLPLLFVYLVFVFMDYAVKKYRQAEENQDRSSTLGDGEQPNKDSNRSQS